MIGMVAIKKWSKLAITFWVIWISSGLLKLIPILNYNFPFTYDQGRDMLDIRLIVEGLHPTLIGPTTSINGVFLGPFWYYFNVPPYLLSGGDPAVLVYWTILFYQLAPLLFWWILRKKYPVISLITCIFWLVMPMVFYSSRFSWSANPMPVFTIFYILSLIYFWANNSVRSGLILGLTAGISMQVESAFGVLFFPYALAFSLFLIKRPLTKKSFLPILAIIISFGSTLLPQALFEIRHSFVMTQTFIKELTGSSAILGERLTWMESFISHRESFWKAISNIFPLDYPLPQTIWIVSLGIIIWRWKTKQLDQISQRLTILSLTFITWAFFFYSFYHHPLKGWYILGLAMPLSLIPAVAIYQLIQWNRFAKYPIILGFLVIVVITWQQQSLLIPKPTDRSTDKSNTRNQMETIDWIYQQANGQAFKAFTYVPAVYDYPYQYLFWWHGRKTYGYLPQTYAYLENVPEYVPGQAEFTQPTKTSDQPLIFLIIQQDPQHTTEQQAWLGNFAKLELVKTQTFPWDTVVEIRKAPNK